MSGVDDVFEPREPPPAGWTRLKVKITEAERRRTRRRVRLTGVVALAAVAVAVVVSPLGANREDPLQPLLQADPALLERAGLVVPAKGIRVEHGAAALASRRGEVVFYRILTVAPEAKPLKD
jgi:hypothetical protein